MTITLCKINIKKETLKLFNLSYLAYLQALRVFRNENICISVVLHWGGLPTCYKANREGRNITFIKYY